MRWGELHFKIQICVAKFDLISMETMCQNDYFLHVFNAKEFESQSR